MTVSRSNDRRASLLFLSLALATPLVVSACNKPQERPPRPVATVSVVTVRRASAPYMIEANGVVVPLQSASVSSQVDGLILSVDFQEGQEVHAGQPLFHIDPRPYQNTYEQAAAVLARDSATAANAKGELDRVQKLIAAKVITPQEAAASQTTAASTEATVRADRATLASARFNLENTIIRAPISGKTGGLLVKQGNLVRAGGATPLVLINQVRPITVRFSIPSSQLGLILQYGAQGGLPVTAVAGGLAAASPSIDSLAAAATMNPVQDPAGQSGTMRPTSNGGGNGSGAGVAAVAGQAAAALPPPTTISGERTTGKLTFIDNAVDTTTGTVQLKATFDNTNGRLWAGQFASTSLHLYDQDSALVIPVQAVVTGQRGSYVYVIDQADTARQRAVTVERTAGGLAIISSGVREGDRVVLDGQSRLTPDAPVKLRSATGVMSGDGAVSGRRGGRGGRGGNGGPGSAGGKGGRGGRGGQNGSTK
jgi:membrane fusion protein, multidrug efflux system